MYQDNVQTVGCIDRILYFLVRIAFSSIPAWLCGLLDMQGTDGVGWIIGYGNGELLAVGFLFLITCLDLDQQNIMGLIIQWLGGAQGGAIDLEKIMMWVIPNEGEGMPVLLVRIGSG